MTRAMEAKGIKIDEPSNNSGLDISSIIQNHETGECSGQQSHGTHHGSIQTQFSCLDFPHFDGKNPTRWIYKTEQFFHYQKTVSGRSLSVPCASTLDLRIFEDFDEALAKLQQTGTVREYQTQFKRLAACVRQWP
nr:hypothetical protein CFP56_73700 [Quercus suber]